MTGKAMESLMDLYDALMTTRAMRRFTDEPVSDEQVEACLRAAVQAPSGGNVQPYEFLVVTDPELRARIGELYLRAWERYIAAVMSGPPPPGLEHGPAGNFALGAKRSDELARALGDVPVHVLVLMPKFRMIAIDAEGEMDVGPAYASVYPAVQNLILAARSQGLGTVLTTVYRIHEDELRDLCGIPDKYEIVALLPLGYPRGKWGVAPRRQAEALTSWNRFDDRRAT